MAVVRDFIYIDNERLNSLYSQVFEGVVNTIVESELHETEDVNTNKGGIKFTGSTLEEKVAAASYKTQSKLLYDHMYNLLESRIGNALLEPVDLDLSNYINNISQSSMLKIRGTAEVWDYARLRSIFEGYNEVGLALTYITGFESIQNLEELKNNLENQIKEVKRTNTRKNELPKLQQQLADLKRMSASHELARSNGLHFDPSFLKHLSLLTSTFYSNGIEILIYPQNSSENILFRSVLDMQWLRISPERLRALYAGQKATNWVVVGQVTYIPTNISQSSSKKVVSSPTESSSLDIDPDQPKTVRDAFRQIIDAYYGIERTFAESQKIVEIIIHPLAIYREVEIYEQLPIASA